MPEPITSRTCQLPPPTDAPSSLPVGAPIPDPHADPTAAILEGAIHAVGELIHVFGPGLGTGLLGTAGAVGEFAIAVYSAASTLVHVVRLPHDSAVHGMLAGGLRAGGSPADRAFALGAGAALAGLTPTETRALRESLPRQLRSDFDNGLATLLENGDRHPEAFAEAQREYRALCRAWQDGIAAAIGGWDDASRGEVFAAGREQMARYLEAHPCEAEALRASYRAAHREGFLAADAGTIDHARAERDAAYRAGIEYFRRLEHGGDAERLEAERSRIEGFRALALAGRIAG